MSEALEILKSCDAFLEGHFLLSSGRHSGAYCQMAYLQQYPDRCAEVMKAVADKVKEMDVDVIVGPAMGGIVYAYELARQTGKRAIFTERVDNVITITSLDNGTSITLDRNILSLHRKTKKELLKYGLFYKQIVDLFPEQELYVKAIICDKQYSTIEEVIALDNFKIVS
jgi:hypothetical protein